MGARYEALAAKEITLQRHVVTVTSVPWVLSGGACRGHVRGMDLAGQILIAMPGMADPRFERSVVLLCAHSAEGAMGLIVNKPLEELSFSGLLGQSEHPRGARGP